MRDIEGVAPEVQLDVERILWPEESLGVALGCRIVLVLRPGVVDEELEAIREVLREVDHELMVVPTAERAVGQGRGQ